MLTIATIAGMKDAARAEKSAGRTIGFVPTMGYLHEGHLSLVRASKAATDTTVVSIFVNPAQFGPREDYARYPRDFERDSAFLIGEGTDILFSPEAAEMYPPDFRTFVEVERLQDKLCGRTRPGHFRGVCTVVLKLFEIIRPEKAYFGQKDAQQALILKKMAADFNLDVELNVRPIVREPDGLAMSSRNQYLSPGDRRAAVVLNRSLEAAAAAIRGGERRPDVVIGLIRGLLGREPAARIEYVEIVEARLLEAAPDAGPGRLIALAVYFGNTRLIDNLIIPAEG